MSASMKTVVVLGGSYVGLSATKALASSLPATHRVLLVEQNSHFNHLFAFPRFAVLPSHEHKAFIPYSAVFKGCPNAESHAVVKARAVGVTPDSVVLDREWQNSREISFDYLVVATGTTRPEPFGMSSDNKTGSITCLQSYQKQISAARAILIIGGGANGVQLAADIKELHPEKDVCLAHSRQQLLPDFHQDLDVMVKERFRDLGVRLVLGARLNASDFGVSAHQDAKTLKDYNGELFTPDLVISATGQAPNTEVLSSLPLDPGQSLINPANRFLRVKPTLQLDAPQYQNIYVLGDVADTGARKAARPGLAQAQCVAKNIVSAIDGKAPDEKITITPFAIHLTLGLKQNVIFRNPNPGEGQPEPVVILKDDGLDDMGIERVWTQRGVEVRNPSEYHL